MSNIRKLKVEIIIDKLKQIQRDSTFEHAGFSGNDDEEDSSIKEKTKLFRHTWIIKPLGIIIEELGRELKR